MSRLVSLLALLLGLAACGEGELEIAFVAFPQVEETVRSIILATRAAGRVRGLEAIDLEAEAPVWQLPAEDEVLIEALLYEKSLSDLGVDVGPVLQGPPESRRGLPKSEAASFELKVAESGSSPDGWVRREQRSAQLEAVRLPEDGSECPRVFATNFSLPSRDNGVCAGRLPDRQVLLGDARGVIWITNGAEPRALTRTDGDAFGLTSFDFAPDTEELFFGTPGGQIHHGTIDGDVLDVQFVTAAPTAATLRFLDIVTGRPNLELYTMSVLGEVLHYVGSRWTLLYDFERSGAFAGLQGFIRLEDESGTEILAVAAEDNRVASIRDGVVEMQDTPSPSGLVEIALIDGLGPVIGNDRGQVFARVNEQWQMIGPTDVAVWVTVVASVEPGLLLYATAFGNLGLLRDGTTCSAQQVFPSDPFWLVPVGPLSERRFIAFGDVPAEGELWYSEIRVE